MAFFYLYSSVLSPRTKVSSSTILLSLNIPLIGTLDIYLSSRRIGNLRLRSYLRVRDGDFINKDSEVVLNYISVLILIDRSVLGLRSRDSYIKLLAVADSRSRDSYRIADLALNDIRLLYP